MEKHTPLTIGGQAVIEGVMIRTPECITVAVRKPSGAIVTRRDAFESLTKKIPVLGLPILRGIINLFEMIIIGMRALNFSTEQAFADSNQEKTSRDSRILTALSFALSIMISLALGIALFKFIPLFLTEKLRNNVSAIKQSVLLFNLTDGIIRIAIFFLYIGTISLFKSFRRIFEYHGAEHKTIFTYEKGLALTLEHTKEESPRHPRCGTSFLIIVLLLSILLLSLVPRHSDFMWNLLRRLSIIPLIAGVAYELLKFTAKYESNPIMKLLTYPGLWTQYITTKEPDEKQLEVAIAAVEKAVENQKN